METGQATAAETDMANAAVDTYRRLTAGEVLADLANLGVDELLLVEQLELAGDARGEILDRIDYLLTGFAGRPAHPAAGFVTGVVDQGEDSDPDGHDDWARLGHYDEARDGAAVETEAPEPAPPVPPAAPVVEARPPSPAPPVTEARRRPAPPTPMPLQVSRRQSSPPVVAAQDPNPPKKMVSESLLDQMGTLLERDALRRPDAARIATTDPAPDVIPQPPDDPIPAVISARRPGRTHRRGPVKVLGGLAIVAAVGVAAFTVLGPKSKSTGAAAPLQVTTTTVPLAERLLTAVPGYVLQPPSVGDAGLSSLAKAVRYDRKADAQQALIRDGFARGYQRLWNNTPQRQAILFVYQFKNAAGAQAYAQRMIEGNRADAAALNGTVADFALPSIPGAVGLSSTSTSGASAGAVFTRDTYVVEVAVHLPAPADEDALVQQLAVQQYGLL